VVNAFVLFSPRVAVGSGSWLVFDVLGVLGTAGLVALAAVAGIRGTRALARDEGWAPALGADGRASEAARRPSLVEGEALSLV
jgi:hypothetical protein